MKSIKKINKVNTIKSRGVVYVAFGPLYLCMALFSMSTLRKRNADLPVMIITNIDFDFNKFDYWSEEHDIVKLIDFDSDRNREIKTAIYEHVPFERAAYIDADTYILGDLSNIWTLLDYFDIAFKLNPIKQKTPGKGDQLILGKSLFVRDVPHFNGGVFFFKKSKNSKGFFDLWNQYFCERKIPYDQISLIDAIFNCGARILPLTGDWNYFPDWRFYAGKVKSPLIVHYSNRISFSLERELLKIATTLNLKIETLEQQISNKRLVRRKKIGWRHWLKMLFYWRFFSKNEEKKWY